MKTIPLILAALAVLIVILRWRKQGWEQRIVLLIAAAALVVYGTGVVHVPDLEKLLKGVGSTLGAWTYLLVGGLAFLETGAFVGLLAPGETAIILGGFVAGQGEINVVLLIGIVWGAAVAGDTTSFLLGRKLGRDFMLKYGPKVRITEPRVEWVEGFFQKHGGKTILIARFVGLARALAPFIAGSSGMKLRRFLPFDIIGAGIWSASLVLIGFIFWKSFDRVTEIAAQGALALGIVISVIVGVVLVYTRLRTQEGRDRAKEWIGEKADHPWARPIVRVLTPVYTGVLVPFWNAVRSPVLWVWARLTPGGLGLELTTLVALFLVGAFTLVAFATFVTRDSFAQVDSDALKLARELSATWLDDIARVFSALGAIAAAVIVSVAAAIFLFVRKRIPEALALLLGVGLIDVIATIIQATAARPHPSGAVINTVAYSFPSEHAALSVTFVAAAVAVAHALPKFAHRVALVTVSIVLVSLICLSRLYLQTDYPGDVLGGLGLGVAIFSFLGSCALVINYFAARSGPVSSTPSS